jgi:voltage-gated potassium channel
VAIVPGKRAISDPDLRDRLYELLEHDHLPHSAGSRFVRLIVAIIVIDVLVMILASVPEFDARLGLLFTVVEVAAVVAFALEYAARIWSVVGHSLRDMTPTRARYIRKGSCSQSPQPDLFRCGFLFSIYNLTAT